MGLFFKAEKKPYRKQNTSASPGMRAIPYTPKSWEEMVGIKAYKRLN